jgi:electron transfer flavoprotein alpha subunit
VANVLVYIERKNKEATAASLLALNAGRWVASTLGAALHALVPCASPPSYGQDDIIAVLSRHGADKVILLTHQDLDGPALFCTHGPAIRAACEQFRPRLLLFPATAAGDELAPRLALQIGAGYLANARLELGESDVLVTCDVFRRRFCLSSSIRRIGAPLVLTLLQEGEPQAMADDEAEVVVVHGSTADTTSFEVLGRRQAPQADPATARVVVGAGSNLGAPATFDWIRRLAAALGGAPAASPAACAAGLAPLEMQVGMDGGAIDARLYLTFGAAGSEEHLAALSPATALVAVGANREAPIFEMATLGLVADPAAALERLLAQLDPEDHG